MSRDKIDTKRRRFLTTATTVLGGIGVAYAAYPFLASWLPSTTTKAMGAPVLVDVTQLEFGSRLVVEWRGKPIWIVRRSQQTLDSISSLNNVLNDPNSLEPQQPSYAQNTYRSIKPEYFVVEAICTHLGCVPTYNPGLGEIDPDWKGGFFCPCHGSKFDMAGRVYKGVPAPTNLVIPPYRYVSDTVILIGEGSERHPK